MTALELLTTLRELGVTLTLWVDRLHVDAPQGALTPVLRVAIREHKAKLLDLLEDCEERASLMEYDGRVPRAEAERLAWACVQGEASATPPAATEESDLSQRSLWQEVYR